MAVLSIKLTIPDEIMKKYELRGSLEKVISEHLEHTADFTSSKPLYITDTLRKRLDRLFGKNFSSAEDLVHVMERYVTARIGDVDIQLSPLLLSRLKSRCFGKPFETFLSEQTIKGLEEFAGMR